jgi:hypothetical protein
MPEQPQRAGPDLLRLPDLPMPDGHAQARQRALVTEIRAVPAAPGLLRGSRRRRRLALAAAGLAVLAGAVALPSIDHLTAPAAGTHAQLAAFTVVPNPDGTVTLTLRRSQDVDATALTTALNQAGVRALVKVGVVCDGRSAAGIWKFQTLRNNPGNGLHTLVISPVAVPQGSLLVISIPQPTDGAGLRLTVSPSGTPPTCHTPTPQDLSHNNGTGH